MVKGSFLMLLAVFLFTVVAVLTKLAAVDYGIGEVVFYRSLLGALLCWLIARRKGVALATKRPLRHLVRCTIGTTSIALGVYILTVMPIATAQTLTYTGPLWFCLFLSIECLLRKERIDLPTLAAVGVGFVGVLLILRPDMSGFLSPWAPLFGILTGLTGGGADFMIRNLSQHGEPPERIVFYFTSAGTVAGFALSSATGWTPLTPHGITLLLGIGVAATLAQLSLTSAWTYGNALLNAIFSFAAIPFALAFGVFLFLEPIDWISGLGILIVTGAGVAASVRRMIKEREASARTKTTLSITRTTYR